MNVRTENRGINVYANNTFQQLKIENFRFLFLVTCVLSISLNGFFCLIHIPWTLHKIRNCSSPKILIRFLIFRHFSLCCCVAIWIWRDHESYFLHLVIGISKSLSYSQEIILHNPQLESLYVLIGFSGTKTNDYLLFRYCYRVAHRPYK